MSQKNRLTRCVLLAFRSSLLNGEESDLDARFVIMYLKFLASDILLHLGARFRLERVQPNHPNTLSMRESTPAFFRPSAVRRGQGIMHHRSQAP